MDSLSPTLLTGDCREILPTLPAESVHCCITSPPYWGLRDYGVENQIGLERTPEEHVEALVGVFREVKRVLRNDGTLWLNYGDCFCGGGRGGHSDDFSPQGKGNSYPRSSLPSGLKPKDLVGMPWRVAFALQADGWWLRCDIIWSKANPMPESVTDRPTRAHEYLFLLAKSPRYFYDHDAIREPHSRDWDQQRPVGPRKKMETPGPMGRNGKGQYDQAWEDRTPAVQNPSGRNKRTVWEIPTQPTPEAHFATFPEALVTPCILAGTSEWGCCSECGSPWRRLVEVKGGTIGKAWHDDSDDLGRGQKVAPMADYRREFKGWQPSCKCGTTEGSPCLVLDPFCGSGTVGKVATKLGRRSILIELSPAYGEISNRRNAQLGLLL